MMVVQLLTILVSFLISLSAEARILDRTVAIVNADVITLSDTTKFRRYFNLRKEVDPFVAFFGLNPEALKDITDHLIQETLVTQKMAPSKADVDEEIQTILRKNNIELDALKNILSAQGVSFEAYTQLMGISVAKRKLIDRELRPLAVVTEDEVKNFYYTDPAFLARKKKQELLLSYDLSQARIEGQQLATEISDRIAAGEDFDAVTARYVDRGVRTAALGVLREDSLSQQIRNSLDGLKVGDSSKPVALGTDFYVIHKINSISAPKDPVFEREKSQIQSILYQRAMQRQLQLWTERERRSAFIHIPE
jgi:peptidyl-prolyl cis-trans isomerase SurA